MLECRKADLGENQGTVLEYEWRMRAWGGGGVLLLLHFSTQASAIVKLHLSPPGTVPGDLCGPVRLANQLHPEAG